MKQILFSLLAFGVTLVANASTSLSQDTIISITAPDSVVVSTND